MRRENPGVGCTHRGRIPTRGLLPVLPMLRALALRGEHRATEQNAASFALVAVKRAR